MVVIQPDIQINRFVSIIFIVSIISIIIVDRMDIWADQSVGWGRGFV